MTDPRDRSPSKNSPIKPNFAADFSQRRAVSFPTPKQDWREETKKIWSRTVDKLPIAIDLPRLAAHLYILDARPGATKPILLPEPPTVSSYDQVLSALYRLTYVLEGPEEADELREEYIAHLMRDCDMSIQKAALGMLMINTIGVDSKVACALKAINQSIAAPGSIEIRMVMLPGIPFKDSQKNPWEVLVRVDETTVEIAHLRRQCNFDPRAEENAFDFSWEISMVFNSAMREMVGSSIAVADFSFGPKTSETKKRDLTAVFSQHLKEGLLKKYPTGAGGSLQ